MAVQALLDEGQSSLVELLAVELVYPPPITNFPAGHIAVIVLGSDAINIHMIDSIRTKYFPIGKYKTIGNDK